MLGLFSYLMIGLRFFRRTNSCFVEQAFLSSEAPMKSWAKLEACFRHGKSWPTENSSRSTSFSLIYRYLTTMTDEILKQTKIAIFKGRKIRKTIYKSEWWFSVVDVVGALTDSVDIGQYIKKMRKRESELEKNWGTICTPLEMIAKDGKKRKILAANTEGIFRIIQSIPSPKDNYLYSPQDRKRITGK